MDLSTRPSSSTKFSSTNILIGHALKGHTLVSTDNLFISITRVATSQSSKNNFPTKITIIVTEHLLISSIHHYTSKPPYLKASLKLFELKPTHLSHYVISKTCLYECCVFVSNQLHITHVLKIIQSKIKNIFVYQI